MGRSELSLGRLFGIPFGVDYSWFLVFGLVTWSLATGYFPARFEGWASVLYWGTGLVAALALFGSVVLHELGHALTAKLFHLPVFRIRLMIFGGVAELGDEPPSPAAEFWVAVAGPVVSLVISAGAGVAWLVLTQFATASRFLEPLAGLAGYVALMNVSLAVFNMIPGFPLDGGRVFRAGLWYGLRDLSRATRIAAGVGRAVGLGFVAFGFLSMFSGGLSNGLWLVLVGFFLQNAATAESNVQTMRDILRGHNVAHLMLYSNSYPHVGVFRMNEMLVAQESVRPETSVWDALRVMNRNRRRQVEVVAEGRLLGVIGIEDIYRYMNALQRPRVFSW